jgi:metal iron transporter
MAEIDLVAGNVSPSPSVEKQVFQTVSSVSTDIHVKKGFWEGFKRVLLAKAPLEDAPLEFGGHRIAEEPNVKGGFVGILTRYGRFFGPGMIVVVAYIDPDNLQTSVGDGQDFGYKMLFMVLFSLVLAIYLQVSYSSQPVISSEIITY